MIKVILQTISEMRKRIENDVGDKYNAYFDALYSEISQLSENLPKQDKRDWLGLANKMINIYTECGCTGRKEFTNRQWISDSDVIAQRLKSPRVKKLLSYSDEEILDATKRYIDVPEKRYKRTLLYFIWKDDEKGFCSDLLDYLKDKQAGDTVTTQNNWLYGN